jgi:MFS family permease
MRFRIRIAHLTAGGSWAVQLSDSTQKNLRNFFFDGLFSAANDSITLTYLTLFVLSLGASSSDIGLMTALASLSATLLLIPGAMLVDKIGSRKKIILISGGFASNFCLLLLASIPLFLKGPFLVYIAIAIKVIMDGLRNFSIPAWVSLTGDVIPLSFRGRYFATRNLIMGFAAMVVMYLIGQLITRLGEPIGYQWSLLLAFVFGITATGFFSRIRDYRDIDHEIPSQGYSLKSLIRTLSLDRNFLAFCIFASLWTFSLNIAAPFFNVFLVKDLGATASIIGLVTVVGKISSIPAQRFFGPLVDRWGARRLMRLMAFFIPILPFYWYFVQEPWQVIPINIIGGILWAGMNLSAFNMLLDVSPQEQRARYSAMYQIAVALSAAVGALLGGFVADYWGIRFVFLLSAIGRLLSASVYSRFVQQPPNKPVGYLEQSIG